MSNEQRKENKSLVHVTSGGSEKKNIAISDGNLSWAGAAAAPVEDGQLSFLLCNTLLAKSYRTWVKIRDVNPLLVTQSRYAFCGLFY